MIKFITDKMLKYIILSFINFIMSCDLGHLAMAAKWLL